MARVSYGDLKSRSLKSSHGSSTSPSSAKAVYIANSLFKRVVLNSVSLVAGCRTSHHMGSRARPWSLRHGAGDNRSCPARRIELVSISRIPPAAQMGTPASITRRVMRRGRMERGWGNDGLGGAPRTKIGDLERDSRALVKDGRDRALQEVAIARGMRSPRQRFREENSAKEESRGGGAVWLDVAMASKLNIGDRRPTGRQWWTW